MAKTSNLTEQRDYSLDFITGIMILYMIYLHIAQWSGTIYFCVNQFFSNAIFFFMPWFFFKSGLFHKPQSFREVLIKNFKKLLLPFAKFSLIGCLVYDFYLLVIQHDSNIIHYTLSHVKSILLDGQTVGNMALWFLVALFLAKIIIALAEQFRINLLVLLIIAIGISILYSSLHTSKLLYIGYTSLGVIFYIFGIISKSLNIKCKWPIFIGALAFVIALPSNVDMHMCTVMKGSLLLWIVSSSIMCLLFKILLSKKISKPNIVSYFGENSMIYYVWHWIVLEVVFILINLLEIEYHWYKFSLFVLSMIVFFFIQKLRERIKPVLEK